MSEYDPSFQPPDGAIGMAAQLDSEMRMAGFEMWQLGPVASRALVTQLEADLATIRAALKRTQEEKVEALRTCEAVQATHCALSQARTDAEADAKASEMMLRQVCEERDKLKQDLADEADRRQNEHEACVGFIKQRDHARELLRDCPLLHELNGKRVGVVFPSAFEEGGMKFQQDGIAWIERAREEALKL